MKLRCIYCNQSFECEARPSACPHCAVSFSITITPDTPVFEIARAVDKNGFEATFNLAPREALEDLSVTAKGKLVAVYSLSKDSFALAVPPDAPEGE